LTNITMKQLEGLFNPGEKFISFITKVNKIYQYRDQYIFDKEEFEETITEEMQRLQENKTITRKIYSLEDNWESLIPYLHDAEFVSVLNKVMTVFCEQYPHNGKWKQGNDPFRCSTVEGRINEIVDSLQKGEEHGSPAYELFFKTFGKNADDQNVELWQYLYEKNTTVIDGLQDLESEKSPKENELAWYQFEDYSPWLAPIIAVLLSQALNPDLVAVLVSGYQALPVFIKDGVVYYTDLCFNEHYRFSEIEAIEFTDLSQRAVLIAQNGVIEITGVDECLEYIE
jgi:hypothetical protein